ncbi:hypothetical protein KR009_001146 [Drosophila setifemur]|nr:hypothetical protein KR009_001146 [Drosophila setifemur]
MGFSRPRGSAGRGFRGGSSFKPNGGNFNKGSRGGRGTFDNGPPERIIQLGNFSYSCQNDLVCKVGIQDVPYFNAPIFLENKEQIGKIDEIFGTVRDYSVSIKLSENVFANSFKPHQTLFIDPGKLLPIARFLPKPPQPKGFKKKSNVNNRGAIVSGHRGSSIRGGPGGQRGRNSFGNNGFRGSGRGGFNRGRGGSVGSGRGRW